MKIKKFFKPTKEKIIILMILIILSVFFGFFETSNCSIDAGIEECRLCGSEGIFNPLLRPVTFFVGNLIGGFIEGGDIKYCGADSVFYTLWPLDIILIYIILCFMIFKHDEDKSNKKFKNKK